MSRSGLRVAYVAGWSPTRAPGLARYATELAAGLRRTAPDVELVALGGGLSGAPRVLWSRSVLSLRLRRARPDVCHVTSYPAPAWWHGPLVLTLHDLSLLRVPETHPRRRTWLMTPLLRSAARRATAVIAPSRATAADAVALLDLDPARLHVIPEAPSASFRRVTDPGALAAVQRRHDLRPGFLFALGTLEPRKNLARLVDAWRRVRAGGWDGQLVLAGATGWGDAGLDALEDRALAPHLRRLGYVPEPELPALLSLAGAVAYPSLLEGFGLPVIEAMACGVPTVTADRGATAEVADDAALLVDPLDTAALADAIARALTPGPERDRLAAAGPARAASFSWDATARATARVYAMVTQEAG
jgi:glycosyltransferase involved in cell wall biosynthesis